MVAEEIVILMITEAKLDDFFPASVFDTRFLHTI